MISLLLFLEQAQILDGELPEDPAAFVTRLNQLVLREFGRSWIWNRIRSCPYLPGTSEKGGPHR